jgi:hypothetical protein
MKLKQLGEIVFRFYNEGRVNVTQLTLKEADILQYCRIAFANIMRQLYYANKKMNDGDEYYFSSPVLDIKKFALTEPNAVGMRRADMSAFDLYRLPKNSHIPNVYPVGQGCGTQDVGEITQVQPGEENFYLGPEFSDFMFYVVKGRGINTYHVPSCIKEVDVEATYDNDNVEVSDDIAFDVANQVLGVALRIPGFVGKDTDNPYLPPQSIQLKRAIQQPESTVS